MAQQPPGTVPRPGTSSLGGGDTPTPGAARPPAAGGSSSAPGQAVATITTILQNLPNLFAMQAKGTLSELQINQLRQLMHTHYRQVISSSISQGRANPLLNLPADIDPTLPWKGRPPLISKEAYLEQINKYTAHIREMMLQRAASVAAQTKAAQDSASGTTGAVTPAANSTALAPAPPAIPASSTTTPQSNIMSYQQLVALMKLSPEARNEWLSKDPERRISFQLSAKHYTQFAPGAANRSSSPAPANQPDVQAKPLPDSSATAPANNARPPALDTPLAPGAITSASQPAVVSSATDAATTGKLATNEPTSQVGLSADPSASKPAPTATNTAPVPGAGVSSAENESTAALTAASVPIPDSATTNPTTGPTPAFAVALPDAKTFALRPPPPPPEPEPVRRRRKWREFVDELAPGLEMELGVDEVLSELLDSLIDEGVKGAVRLAKHRGSEKVELKDTAFFVDQSWDTTVPGFDALLHKHSHVAPERERKKGKTVAPRAARLGRGRDEE